MSRTHEASGVGRVGPDLLVDLNQPLHDNRDNLPASQSILQPVAEEDCERETLPELVWAGGWTRSLAILGLHCNRRSQSEATKIHKHSAHSIPLLLHRYNGQTGG